MSLLNDLLALYPNHTGPLTPAQVDAAWQTLAARTTAVTVETFATVRTLAARLPADAARRVIGGIRAAAQADPLVDEILLLMRTGQGVDLGHPATAAMVGQLVTAGALQQADADALLALAVVDQPVYPGLTVEQIVTAWEAQ